MLDRHDRVYVATQPEQYPMLSDPAVGNPDFNRLQEILSGLRQADSQAVELDHSAMIYMVTPIMADGVRLGTLVMSYSKTAFLPRFLEIARSGILVALLVILLLIPVSWVWAQRFAVPLVDLANTMGRIGSSIPDDADVPVPESGDEIGRLVSAFKAMLKGLREKENLERQMIFADRLAAVGRLSAAIAHEINNPLGGMLNAISTFRHHGSDDPFTIKTLSLIERGLQQIRETVSALLVEVRHGGHDLTHNDIEDVRTLVLPDAHAKHASFKWSNGVQGTVPLPATPVRQVLINLLLNAERAIGDSGNITCLVEAVDGVLRIVVANDGDYIPQDAMESLFEPFQSRYDAGHGLGLWVTYQLVHQLGGEITAESDPSETKFTVWLPIPKIET
ncbi:MAG TPA: HAMP domain-containing sensor histidine kinase [Rhodocyclaceae bacterium]